MGVGAAASTSVCDSGNMGSIPIRPPTSFRDTSIGRRPGSEPGSWRFDSSSLNHPAHVGQRLVHRAFNSVIAGSIPRMSTICSHRLVAKDPGLSIRGRRFESGCEYHRTHFPVVQWEDIGLWIRVSWFESTQENAWCCCNTTCLARSVAERPVEARITVVRFHGQTPSLAGDPNGKGPGC